MKPSESLFISYNSDASPSVISVAEVAPASLIILPSFNLAKGFNDLSV